MIIVAGSEMQYVSPPKVKDIADKTLLAISDPGLEAIDTKNLPAFLASIRAEIETGFLNQLAKLNQLRWQAMNSVRGYEEDDEDFLKDTSEKRKQLLERGLLNAEEIFPQMTTDKPLAAKIKQKLEKVIKDLVGDRSEVRKKIVAELDSVLKAMITDTSKREKVTASLDTAVMELLKDRAQRTDVAMRKLKKALRSEIKTSPELKEFPEQALKTAVKAILESTKDSPSQCERLKSFLWTNLLLLKYQRYQLSPISGFIPCNCRISMQPLDLYLRRDVFFSEIIKSINQRSSTTGQLKRKRKTKNDPASDENYDPGIFGSPDRLNANAVKYQRHFVFNPQNMPEFRSLRRRLSGNVLIANPTIVTDGFQLYVSFIDKTQPTVEHYFALKKSRANVDKCENGGNQRPDDTSENQGGDLNIDVDDCNGDLNIDDDCNGECNMNIDDDCNSECNMNIDDDDCNGDLNMNIDDAFDGECNLNIHDAFDCGGRGKVKESQDDINSDKSNDPADQQLKTTEISHYLAQHPERAADIKTVMAADEGVRFPIDVTCIDMSENATIDENSQGTKKRMRVRKGCLYQWENEKMCKLEYRKSKRQDILNGEADLGATGTKNSYGWKLFHEGYYQAWIRLNKLLFEFYRNPAIRSDRFRCNVRRQQMYDQLVEQLFSMMGVQQHNGPVPDNRSKLVVLGQQQVSTKHKGHRPSKHAVFWRYFAQKAMAIGVEVVGLTEYNSSKVCMWCCRHIKHDKKKNYRVYYCGHCKKNAHRDDSSSDIHSAVSWAEIIGVKKVFASNQLPKFDKDDPKSICYFRPQLFRSSWMKSNMSENDIVQDPLAKGSADKEGLMEVVYKAIPE